ncbi:MAG: hypothetical protein SGBAC_007813 [Bacillariaceae sp.]
MRTASLLLLCILHSQRPAVIAFTSHRGPLAKPVSRQICPNLDRSELHLLSQPLSKRVKSSDNDGLNRATVYMQDDVPIGRKKEFKVLSDFKEGFNRVHADYLNLFWTYSVSKSMRYVLPLFLFLASARFFAPELGQTLSYGFELSLKGFYRLSSVVDAVLWLPLKAAYAVVTTAIPVMMIPLLELMPQSAAIGIISPILFLRTLFKGLSSNFLFSTVAVSVGRPVVEEIKYRFLLNSAIGDKGLSRWFGNSNSTIITAPMAADVENMNTSDPSGAKSRGTVSKTCLWTSLFFAVTRFGWLSSKFDTRSTSPYAWTVEFCLSVLAHLSSVPLVEVRPMLQYALSFLALHQAVTTFLVAVNIYEPMYRSNGLMASIGSHVAWTTGIPTIPFRIAKKVYEGTKKGPNTIMTNDAH